MRLNFLPIAATCLAACLQLAGPARCDDLVPRSLPSFAELEAEGAKIGAIRILSRNIFELDDPREDNSLYRFVNTLHVITRPGLTEHLLLFKTGEPVSVRVIDETERLLLSNRFFYEVVIRPAAYHDGVVDIEVATRDTWTLGLTGKYSRSGGSNSTSFGIKEYNFLGTGARVGIAQVSDAERKGSEYEVAYPRAFGSWTDLGYFQAHYDDGNRRTASIVRPFYQLDARWTAGATWDRWNRIDTIYNASETTGQYRHGSEAVDIFAGWSPGMVNRWVQRYSAGVTKLDDTYEIAADHTPPPVMPVDHDVRGPYLRYELIEDQFRKTRNRDQIARPEFVAMGFNGRLQVTRALESWGSDQSDWLYSASVSDGVALAANQDIQASGLIERSVGSSGEPLDHLGGSVRYFATHGTHAAFHASLMGDRIKDAPAPDQFRLGGEQGLRGYPLNYQNGDNRVVLTIEERYYTDWYPLRLLRVGGAIFYDVGRAWGGVNQNTVNGGWLNDVGFGLRLLLDRASFAKVLHADVAMPLNRAPGVKSVQFHVKTELTF